MQPKDSKSEVKADGGKQSKSGKSYVRGDDEDPFLIDEEERKYWRRKIRKVIGMTPEVEEEVDPVKRGKKCKGFWLILVEEDDPNWPEDADGRGFNLDSFFNKITIKNVKKDDNDENYDSEDEVVWQDESF